MNYHYTLRNSPEERSLFLHYLQLQFHVQQLDLDGCRSRRFWASLDTTADSIIFIESSP